MAWIKPEFVQEAALVVYGNTLDTVNRGFYKEKNSMTLCFAEDCTETERQRIAGLMLRVIVEVIAIPKAPVLCLRWGPCTFHLILQ